MEGTETPETTMANVASRFIRCPLLLLLVLAMAAPAFAQRAVFVVRHAERADGGAASMMAATDPPLSEAGAARAERLAALLADAGVTAAYATEYKRTISTIEPLARRLGFTVQQVPAKDATALITRIRASGPDDVVVVAGHSNTVPDILKALGVTEAVTIGDDEYDNLFIVVPRGGSPPVLLRLKY